MKLYLTQLLVASATLTACSSRTDPTLGFKVNADRVEWNRKLDNLISDGTLTKDSTSSFERYKFVWRNGENAFPAYISLNNGRYHESKLFSIFVNFHVDSLAGRAANGEQVILNSSLKFHALSAELQAYFGRPDSVSSEDGKMYWRKDDMDASLDRGTVWIVDSSAAPVLIPPTLYLKSKDAEKVLRSVKEKRRRNLQPKDMLDIKLLPPVVFQPTIGTYQLNVLYSRLVRTQNEDERGVQGAKLDIYFKNEFGDELFRLTDVAAYWGYSLKPGSSLNTGSEIDGIELLLRAGRNAWNEPTPRAGHGYKVLLRSSDIPRNNGMYGALQKLIAWEGTVKSEAVVKAVIFDDGTALKAH